MIVQDFHIHTNFCDGTGSPREMIEAAIARGMKKIGLVCHSYTPFDKSYCIKEERIDEFISVVKALAAEYSQKITVLCGVEQDFWSECKTDRFDFAIGSVHYVKKGGVYRDIDLSRESFSKTVDQEYGGDFFAFCEDYYSTLGDIKKRTGANIVGHFDLITKFNQDDCLFDTRDARYQRAAYTALDKLLGEDVIFEVNTGAISRGYKSEAYPSLEFVRYIHQNGGRLVLSSDSHSIKTIGYDFERYEQLLFKMGIEINEAL